MYALGRPSKILCYGMGGKRSSDSAPGCFVRFREADQDTRMTGLGDKQP